MTNHNCLSKEINNNITNYQIEPSMDVYIYLYISEFEQVSFFTW